MKYCWKYHFKYVLERTVYPLVPFSDYTTLILYWASPQNMVCKYLESKSSWYNNNLLGSVLIYIVKMILTSVGSNVPLPWGRPSNTFRTRGQFPNKDIDLVSYSYRSSQIYQHGDPKFGPLPPPSRDSICMPSQVWSTDFFFEIFDHMINSRRIRKFGPFRIVNKQFESFLSNFDFVWQVKCVLYIEFWRMTFDGYQHFCNFAIFERI